MSKEKKTRTWPLSVLLVRRDLKTDDQILGDLDPLVCLPLALPDEGTGKTVEARLYFERRPFQPPKWASFFGDLLEDAKLPRVSSAPSVLLVPVDDRTLVVAFSYGSALLEPGSTDATFGLRVSLNSINAEEVRSYDKRSFDALFRQTREQAAKGTRLENFGIDAERDLVRTVAGKPTDPLLGSTMSGSESLRVSARVTPRKLVHYLRRLYWKSTQTFEESYPWLGQIEEIRGGRRELLDSYLDDRIAEEEQGYWLAVPEIVDWGNVNGFRFVLPNRSRSIFSSLELANLRKAMGEDAEVSVDFLKRQRVEMVDSEDRRIKQWKLYSCLNAEIRIGAEAYVLSSGVWYKVDTDLLAEVDREVNGLEVADLPLPQFNEFHRSENGYAVQVAEAEPRQFCCLDGQNIMFGGGKSRFELCDLLHRTGDLVHLKRYGGSSVLSHLFAQGLLSAELLMKRPRFRKGADKLVKGDGFSLSDEKRFEHKGKRRVIYVIIGGPANQESRTLPLFSRINLRNAARGIRAFDWEVGIQYVSETAMVQNLRKAKK